MRMQNRFFAFFLAFLMVALVGCASSSKQRGTGEYIDDATISTKVKAALVGDPETSALQINVETYKGVVQLSGFVDSQSSMNRAVVLTKSVQGVKSVKNNMVLRQ